jgi:U3 small nucleolar ribonucleoprotein protein IMP3
MRRYHIQGRDDYAAYNRLVGLVTKLAATLKRLPPSDPERVELTDALLGRLYDLGAIPARRSLADVAALSTSAFARRRLAIVMVRLRMADTPKAAAAFVEAGHVRVGPTAVTDPAFHVSRAAEDWVTWTDTSGIKRKVAAYNDAVDDFDLLEA